MMFKMEDTVSITVNKCTERPRVHGRFLYLGHEKFFIRGVTYGPFAPNMAEEPFPEPSQVAKDFQAMAEAGINTVRVYYVPPRWLLDLANKYGLYLLIGIPWPQHICFLDQWEVKEQIKETIREAARSCSGHPGVLAYLIGNEIPSHIVRWHGPKLIADFLKKLTGIIHEEDPAALVTYANYPSTEYLRLDFLDFYSINVYLQEEKSFCSYVKRLQNVAGNLPLVLSEFGLDSMRNGAEQQGAALSWQIRSAFELGVSGAFVFAWTDEWFTGGNLIEDWAFGMVDAQRNPKPALAAVSKAYKESIPAMSPEQPMISAVVCAYNAQSTLEGCLSSFLKVPYPFFEVIIVNDGSTDATAAIADKYAKKHPDIFRVIHQSNKGLSFARNAGMYAARGSIVAYTDSDCYIDQHWLHFMALAFQDGRFAAVGGPNLAPPEDNRTAACVSVSPGAPTHVLLTDEIAEHIPGCNMAFRREDLLSIQGFDATYRAAGDDVDVCWRLQNSGKEVGFSASMTVWHHRRNTVKAYLRQQVGYGRSEALLAPKHPERFNVLGNSRWAGRIYGDISGHILTAQPVIYHGVFGYGLFQTLYAPKANVFNCLPLAFEWIGASLLLMILGFSIPLFGFAGAGMLGATLAWCIHRASQARLPRQYDDWKSCVIITLLTFLQPVVRGWTRYLTLMELAAAKKRGHEGNALTARAWLALGGVKPKSGAWQICRDALRLITKHFTFNIFFWNHESMEREAVLDRLFAMLIKLSLKPKIDSGYSSSMSVPPWDMQIQPGFWSQVQLRITVEHHGGTKRFIRLRGTVLPSALATACYLTATALTVCALVFNAHMLAIGLLALLAGLIGLVVWDHFRAAAIVALISKRFVAAQTEPPAVVRLEAAPAPAGQPDLEGMA